MYEYAHREKFYLDNTRKLVLISFSLEEGEEGYDPEGDNLVILSNNDIIDDTYEHNDGITDQQSLNFQNCMSSYIKFSTVYVERTLYGRWIYVQEIIDDDTENPIPIGSFHVASNNMSLDGKSQDVIAYDALYDIINCDTKTIKEIYDSFEFPITVKDLRDAFLNEFGIEQDNASLINDDILLPKQLGEEDFVGGSEIVSNIAEINGVFPHIGKDGLLHWISLDRGDINIGPLYPSLSTFPGEQTFPGDGYSGLYIDVYKDQYQQGSVIWSNFATLPPDGVQIRNATNGIAYYYQDHGSDNPYTVINNFLCYDLSDGQYEQIAKRLFNKISLISYIPFEMLKMADPCLEPGDRVFIRTEQNVSVPSYIFNKHTSGINVGWDDIQTSGTYELGQYDINQVSSTNAKLKNLDNRVGNIEKSGSGPLQIQSVSALPDSPQLNVLYLIQGTVRVE